ncbi:phosphoadenosine phosphosulfate reductase [Alsobacter metallidurans]|uniref:Adenosine 5'-phosphosulfate reductase n=1 Tax=Alsobacter metallidurans TaxID=340221 RepID=A0A917IAR4_9HYPH|nr:phosphoadenylyl-sulfate reductase [Alsobacter metallidurans]GGH27080.1 phosphoadenosine phosphosulfate reductase [Alsobacter metallidurans]
MPLIKTASTDSPATLPDRLDAAFGDLPPALRLRVLRRAVSGAIVFTTSFGLEDQALTHCICDAGVDVEIVTLDTGRLFPETYTLWAETEQRYKRRIRAYYPRHEDLGDLVFRQGVNGFFNSAESRKACCGVRKVEPLRRALDGASAWVTGLRGDQSANRQGMGFVSLDQTHELLKANPLFDWSRDAVLAFAEQNDVPLNPLHAKGFPSIGCAPCTRAVAPGEPERAGRWWWEEEAKKECGLHVAEDGRLVRAGASA